MIHEEWASKSLRVSRERAFRDARIAARNARMYPDGVPAGADVPGRGSKVKGVVTIALIGVVGAALLYRLTAVLNGTVEWSNFFSWQ